MEIGKSQEFSEFQRAISTLDNNVENLPGIYETLEKNNSIPDQ